MSLDGTRFEGNEIAKTDDFNDNTGHLITNFDEAMKILDDEVIVDGLVVSQNSPLGMSVIISEGVAKSATEFLNSDSDVLAIQTSNVTNDRIDIVEIRRQIDETTPLTRDFKDPITEDISQATIDTKYEYRTEIRVMAGTPAGSPVAPSVTAGWLKVAEIIVPASSTTVPDANIYNTDSFVSGRDNTGWTTDKSVTMRSGSISDMSGRIQGNTELGVTEWKNDPRYRYYANISHVIKNGAIYLAVKGNDTTEINTGKDPETLRAWWRLVQEAPAVGPWDETENILYETVGYVIEGDDGKHYSSTGKASNLDINPVDSHPDYWMSAPGYDQLKDYLDDGTTISGDLHPTNDRNSPQYLNSMIIDKRNIRGVLKNYFKVHRDGTQITGNATLEELFRVGESDQYPYLDEIAPDVVGTRTILDVGGHVEEFQTDGGGAVPTVGEVHDDVMQRITYEVTSEIVRNASVPTGALSYTGGSNSRQVDSGTGMKDGVTINFDSANSPGAKTDDDRTAHAAYVSGTPYIVLRQTA